MKTKKKQKPRSGLLRNLLMVLIVSFCVGGLLGIIFWIQESVDAYHVRKAEAFIAAAEYEAAFAEYTKAGGYKFGGYRWVMVDHDVNRVLLIMISKRALPFMAFDDAAMTNDWSDSSLRAWLNGAFLDSFSDEARARIVTVHDTDKVFLLSAEEFKTYLRGHGSGLSWSTVDLDSTRVWESKGDYEPISEYYWWWLRTPAAQKGYAVIVNSRGEVNFKGHPVDTPDGGVRPALWVRLPVSAQ